MVVDDEGRLLLDDKPEHLRVAMEDGELVIQKNMFAYIRKMGLKDVAHP